MELAGLGDNVHLLPALWLVRRQWPNAELHVMVHSHVASLFRLTPWVSRVWAYPALPKPRLAANLHWARELRGQDFDCVVNTTGSDRSSLLTWATRAPVRIGRQPADGGPAGWQFLFTDVMRQPYYGEPMYRQKWKCVRQVGFGTPSDAPRFHVTIDPSLRRGAGIGESDEHRYVHISPFTTAAERELPPHQVAELIARLQTKFPDLRVVLSCAGNAREQIRMDALVRLLDEAPWRVHAGTLDVASLAAVIEKSALNLSGDTGSLHLAMMSGVPAVAWFRAHKGEREWIPQGSQYRVLVAPGGEHDALHGIDTQAILDAASEALAAGRSIV